MRAALAACTLMCWPWHAQAQQAPTRDQNGQSAPGKVASGVTNGPIDRVLSSSIVPQIQLSASADEKVASLSWSFTGSTSVTQDHLSYDQFTFKIATELDKDDSKTILLDASGFPGGTELKLNFTHFSGTISYPKQDSRQRGEVDAAKIVAQKNCEDRYFGSPAATIKANCDIDDGVEGESMSSFIEKYDRKDFDRTFGFYYPSIPFHFYGLEAGANQDTYKYLDRSSFAINKSSKFGYSATVFAGLLWVKQSASLTASFAYARRYEAQAPVTLCQPINATQSQCLAAPDGAPAATRSAVFSIDGRYAFGLGEGGAARYAIAPNVSYDVRNDAYAIDVPFYLASDGEGKLRGGVRVGYTNSRKTTGGGREDDTTIALFVGVPFSLFR